MSKNNRQVYTNQYANREEEMRKAKGNPNRNNHAGKKNGNYGGYTAGNYVADKVKDKVAKQERVKIPKGLRIGITVDLIAIVLLLILRMTVLKGSDITNYVTTLLLGITCVVLFYIRMNYHREKTTLYKMIQFFLCIVAVIYVGTGVIGLLTLAGLL